MGKYTKLLEKVKEGQEVSYQDLVKNLGLDKVSKHKKLTEQLHTTYKAKNADYGDSFGKSHAKYGAIAGLVRISDKFNRIEEIILNGNRQVADETVIDTLIDLSNYALLLAMELEEANE